LSCLCFSSNKPIKIKIFFPSTPSFFVPTHKKNNNIMIRRQQKFTLFPYTTLFRSPTFFFPVLWALSRDLPEKVALSFPHVCTVKVRRPHFGIRVKHIQRRDFSQQYLRHPRSFLIRADLGSSPTTRHKAKSSFPLAG